MPYQQEKRYITLEHKFRPNTIVEVRVMSYSTSGCHYYSIIFGIRDVNSQNEVTMKQLNQSNTMITKVHTMVGDVTEIETVSENIPRLIKEFKSNKNYHGFTSITLALRANEEMKSIVEYDV